MPGAKKFSGESGQGVKTFAKFPGDGLAEVILSGHRIDWTGVARARDIRSLLAGVHC